MLLDNYSKRLDKEEADYDIKSRYIYIHAKSQISPFYASNLPNVNNTHMSYN